MEKVNHSITFRHANEIVFIGSGDLMIASIRLAKAKGFIVKIVLSKRHSEEKLIFHKGTVAEVCRELTPDVFICEQSVTDIPQSFVLGERSLALCFGPAWIFNQDFISLFHYGMWNYNGIPIPEYLGGAHFSWQIMNEDLQGGCFIQEICDTVDRGDIIKFQYYSVNSNSKTPEAYYSDAFEEGIDFLERFLEDVELGKEFECLPFCSIEKPTLYFPRLKTFENSWVDWNWSVDEIDAFCRAFSVPYAGASTQLLGRTILITKSEILERRTMHPFAAGLILNTFYESSSVIVGARGGLLKLNLNLDSHEIELNVGDRLFTPPDILVRAKLYRPRFGN